MTTHATLRRRAHGDQVQRSGRAPAAQRSVAVLYSANEFLLGYPPPKTTVLLPQEPPPAPEPPDAAGNAVFVVQLSESGEYTSCLVRTADGGEPPPRT